MKHRKRKLREKKLKKRRLIITIASILLVSLFTIGYASFNTNVTVSTTGKLKRYKVKFDTNGGYIDINSKYVGVTYGDLPTPTKEGYTFKGWNGKNLFNLDDAIPNIAARTENDILYFDGSSYTGNRASNIKLQIRNGNAYIKDLANFWRLVYTGILHSTFIVEENNFDHYEFILNTNIYDPKIKFNSNLDLNIPYTFSFNVIDSDLPNAKATINQIQIEEGTEATEYEPYYITKDTKVVQKHEHTLTAILEANS